MVSKNGGFLLLDCPLSWTSNQETGEGQNKKFSCVSPQNKKKEQRNGLEPLSRVAVDGHPGSEAQYGPILERGA